MFLDTKYNEKIKRIEVIPIYAFHNVKIGDPSYFEELEEAILVDDKKTIKTLQELTFDKRLNTVKSGVVVLADIEGELNGKHKYSHIDMNIILTPDEITAQKSDKLIHTYLKELVYKGTVKESHNLACDTARFDISIDDKSNEYCTGADGYYGHVSLMKQYYGFNMGLSFDGDLFDLDEIKSDCEYLFKLDRHQDTIDYANQLKETLIEELESHYYHEDDKAQEK